MERLSRLLACASRTGAVLMIGGLPACGGGSSGPSSGALTLELTDAPVDGATAVMANTTTTVALP